MRRFVWLLATVALCVFLAGCAGLSGSSPFAYPRHWDYTRKKPAEIDLSGTYQILQVRTTEIDGISNLIQSFRNRKDVSVKLNSDHTAILFNIPSFDVDKEKLTCSFSGHAKWLLWGDGTGWEIRFDADYPVGSPETTPGACGPQWQDGMTVLGQAPPYRLWLGIGDPDDDTGIEFKLESRFQ